MSVSPGRYNVLSPGSCSDIEREGILPASFLFCMIPFIYVSITAYYKNGSESMSIIFETLVFTNSCLYIRPKKHSSSVINHCY